MIRAMLVFMSCASLSGATRAQSPSPDLTGSPDYAQYSASAYRAGHEQAEKDVKENRLIIETYGLPPRNDGEYEMLLLQKYQIQLKRVAGCVVDHQIVGHARGYNEVSIAEIERRFGKDVLERTRTEAEKRFADKHRK